MEDAEVSVIIPTYDRAYCLDRAVDSVLNQTHRNCRALIIDDGSTDATRALVAQRYANEPRVIYEYQSNQGVVASRNRGLTLARGDYIAFLDSDDAWYPWKVELQLACLAALPASVGMVWTDMNAINAEGEIVQERYLRKMYGAYTRHGTERIFEHEASLDSLGIRIAGIEGDCKVYWGDIFSQMVTGNLVHTSTALLRRERALAVGPFNASLRFAGEDFDYHLRTCRAGSVAFVDVCSILYRVGHVDQLTAPEYHVHIAENFLKTITPVIAQDRARINLPESTIRATLARAHGWIAEGKFGASDYAGARRHAVQSLTYQPWQSRPWVLLGASLIPGVARENVLEAYRALKRWRRGAAQ
jgi:GT2 family glycosyltransferase